jgi:hypothetical protein
MGYIVGLVAALMAVQGTALLSNTVSEAAATSTVKNSVVVCPAEGQTAVACSSRAHHRKQSASAAAAETVAASITVAVAAVGRVHLLRQ